MFIQNCLAFLNLVNQKRMKINYYNRGGGTDYVLFIVLL